MTTNENERTGKNSPEPRRRNVSRVLVLILFLFGVFSVTLSLANHYDATKPAATMCICIAGVMVMIGGIIWYFVGGNRPQKLRVRTGRVSSVIFLPPLLCFFATSSVEDVLAIEVQTGGILTTATDKAPRSTLEQVQHCWEQIPQPSPTSPIWGPSTGVDLSRYSVRQVFANTNNGQFIFKALLNTNNVHMAPVDGTRILADEEGNTLLVTASGDSYHILSATDPNNIIVKSTADGAVYGLGATPNCLTCLEIVAVVAGCILIGILAYKAIKCGTRVASNYNYNLTNKMQNLSNYPQPTFAVMSVRAQQKTMTANSIDTEPASGYTVIATNIDWQQMYRDLDSGWTPPVATNWAGDRIFYQSALAIAQGNLLASNAVSVVPARMMTSTDLIHWSEETEPIIIVQTVAFGTNNLPASSTTVSYMYDQVISTDLSLLKIDSIGPLGTVASVASVVYSSKTPPIRPGVKQQFWRVSIGGSSK